jgi:hypothetical protein
MNQIDFTQTGGFPLDQDVFGFQQLNTFMVQQLAALCGPRAILAGCLEVGSTVSGGYICIDGEVLPFNAGAKQAKLVIREVRTDMNYEDGSVKPSQIERFAEFGDDGVTTLMWADFKRNTNEGVLSRLSRLEWLTAPLVVAHGTMLLWRKLSTVPLPAGWQEVIDWQGKLLMPRTVGVNETGQEYGSNSVTIEKANLPAEGLPVPVPGGATSTTDAGQGRFAMGSDNFDGAGPTLHTANMGSGTPITINPEHRIIMFIEPIPNFIPAA